MGLEMLDVSYIADIPDISVFIHPEDPQRHVLMSCLLNPLRRARLIERVAAGLNEKLRTIKFKPEFVALWTASVDEEGLHLTCLYYLESASLHLHALPL